MQKNDSRMVYAYFSILYFLNMSSRALFTPFFTVYLQEKGLDVSEIGTVMSINSIIIILSQPFWGMIADRVGSSRKVLACCFLFQAAVVFSFNLVHTALLVAATFFLSTFCSSPEGPLVDTWVLGNMKASGNAKGVGKLKFWGCAGYALFSPLGGALIQRYSTGRVTPVFAVLLLLLGLFIWFLGWDEPKSAQENSRVQLGRILRDAPLLIFLAYLVVMQVPHRAAYTFYPLLIEDLGGDQTMIGYTSSVMFISEAVMMFLSTYFLKKLKPIHIVLLSSCFFALWQFLYSGMTEVWQVAAAAVLDGPAFAFLSLGILYYVDEIAPPQLRSTYQTLIYSFYFGLSGIIGNAWGGWAVENIGYQPMYLAGGCLVLVSTLLFSLYSRRQSQKKGLNHT